MARGLDYYTGLIYETILLQGDQGSVAGGGRYDDLIGMFSKKQIPAVGVSIGIERVLNLYANKFTNIKLNSTLFYVASIGNDLAMQRFMLINELWNAGLSAEMSYKINPKAQDQLK